MSAIDDEKMGAYKEAFSLFDQDGNGSISSGELKNVMKSLNIEMGDADVERMIKEVDADASGNIEFNEFVALMMRYEDQDQKDIAEAFEIIDRDGSGVISSMELKQALLMLGQRLSDAEIDDMILEADVDGNGEINREEFTKLMLRV